jgi:hypothetical protein
MIITGAGLQGHLKLFIVSIKKFNKKNMKNLIYLVIFVFAFSIYSCGEKKNEDIQLTGDTTIEQEVTSIEDNGRKDEAAGDKTITEANELGMTPGLPGDYPSDVPQPKNGRVLGSISSSDGNIVTFETPETVSDVVNFYKENMKKAGYNFENEIGDLVKGGSVSWNKGEKHVELMLSHDNEKNVTSVVITYK